MNQCLSHLLSIKQLSDSDIQTVLVSAQQFIDRKQHLSQQLNTLAGCTLFNLFFENSTRTRVSFELAAHRLGATVVNLDREMSAQVKGESLLDTLYTLQAMHGQFFVVRHADNHAAQYLAEHASPGSAIINAGSGTHAHPSQALLDALTIQQYKQDFSQLSIAILGDIKHSRVTKSQVELFTRLGAADIRLIGPKHLLTTTHQASSIHLVTDIEQGLNAADVIIVLRIQQERMAQADIPDMQSYYQQYGLTPERLSLAKPDAIVMHPGPINREVEIASLVADGPQSKILQQVNNGIAMRMAILTNIRSQQ